MKINDELKIVETSEIDLDHIVSLWNDGDVMYYVGFPDGLGVDKEGLKKNWLTKVNQNHLVKHYSIYHKTIGYCGETYYRVEDDLSCALDIKLLADARGKNIAYRALKYAIEQAFEVGKANLVFVGPNKKNDKAIKLYKRLGFIKKQHPDPKYRDTHLYMILKREDYK